MSPIASGSSTCIRLAFSVPVSAARIYLRHPIPLATSRRLIQMAAEHVLHMQKALDQMNLQIHRVLNDITGVSGMRILDAVLAGERVPLTLARLCHGGVKTSEDVIAKSLEGDYRTEHLFALRQSLAVLRYYQQLVLEADQEIQLRLNERPRRKQRGIRPGRDSNQIRPDLTLGDIPTVQ